MVEHRERARVLVERVARIMATRFSIHVSCVPERAEDAARAIEACLGWLRAAERCLTRFDPASDLCRLNAAAGRWCDVPKMLFDVVEQGVVASRASGGLFDPTVLPALERLGYDRDFAELATEPGNAEPGQETAATTGGWREVELDRATRRVRLPASVRMDLGGIAKGWAADEALARFFEPFPDVLINAGGDMRARGHNPRGEPWAVGAGNPRAGEVGAPEHLAVVSLARGGLACSGATARWWYQGSQRRHHLIDPRTLTPARLWLDDADDGELVATATAVAPTAAQAEVAAKVALMRGCPEALCAVEAAWTSNGADAGPEAYQPFGDAPVALVLVLGSGRVAVSANLTQYLATWGGGGDVWLD